MHHVVIIFPCSFHYSGPASVSSHNSSSSFISVHSLPHITKPCPFSSVFPLDTPHVCPFFPPVSCTSVPWSLCLFLGLS